LINSAKIIGLFGGTFDPIHLGHVHLANKVLEKTTLEKINIVPCYHSPFREQPIASANARLEMAKLAFEGNANFFIDDQEIQRQGISYTVDTIKHTRKTLNDKNQPIALIIGIDAFSKFTYWHMWETILTLAHLIVVKRKEVMQKLSKEAKSLLKEREIKHPQNLATSLCGNILVLDIQSLPISATMIRELLRTNKFKEAEKLLPKKVWQYILEKKIYQQLIQK
jgi:nicotinate-nucleotide adenylyltransferase